MIRAAGAALPAQRTIEPRRVAVWAALVLQAAITAVTPLLAGAGTGNPVTFAMIAIPASALVLTLSNWYQGLSPVLAYNAHGVAARAGLRVRRYPWREVDYTWLVTSPRAERWLFVQFADGRRFGVGYTGANARELDLMQRARQAARRDAAGPVPAGGTAAGTATAAGAAAAAGTAGTAGTLPRLSAVGPLAAALGCWTAGLAVGLLLR